MQLTEDMLQAAMKKAIEYGLLPRRQSKDLYLQNEVAMKDILATALDMASKRRDVSSSVSSAISPQALTSDYPVFRSDRRAAYVHGVINKQQQQ